ncbi:hypothetical protein JCGZ_20143 [Jatropha curcas]|uniref:Uncharacterized protein n=1 Tax=Jatropha curcas TaxID=180498 RepID=A0A067JXF9_JATCU|nr:hypothetical protein JCGZ_20143 [Jatropha curcas]
MSGPVVAVSRTGYSSGLWRCGLTSTASTRAVLAVTLPSSPGGFLAIWPTATILTPVARIPITDGASLMTGSCLIYPWSHGTARLGGPIRAGRWLSCTPARRRVPHAPPRHMCLLTREDLEVEYRGFSANDFLSADDFPSYFTSRMQARLPEELENGRLWRHQTCQSSAVSRLQAEVERLRTRLEVEGIPLDSSNEDEDGSSSNDVPPSPPPPAVAGPSRRRR